MSKKIKDGPFKSYHDNGQTEFEVTYKDGHETGPIKHYYDNGNISVEGFFKDGKNEGLFKRYRIDGFLISEKYYKNGKLNGNVILYDDEPYQKISTEENIYEVVVKYEEKWKNDKKHGIQKEYFMSHPKEKKIKFITTYKNGKIDGPYKSFHFNGQLKEERTYKNGKENGHTKLYDREGKLKSWRIVQNGKDSGLDMMIEHL